MILLIVVAGGLGYVASSSTGTITPGVTVNAVDVSDLTPEEARSLLVKQVADMRLEFVAQEQRYAVPVNTAVRSEGQPIASFDIDAAVRKAFEIGHGADSLIAAAQRIDAYVFGTAVKMPITLDMGELEAVITERFGELTAPAQDARFVIRFAGDGRRPAVTVQPEQKGVTIDFEDVAREAASRLKSFSRAPIVLHTKRDLPKLFAADIEPLTDSVAEALRRAPLTLKAKDISWSVSQQQLADWLTAIPEDKPGAGARLGLDDQKIEKNLQARAASLRTEPIDAVFRMEGGKVVEFQPSVDGDEIDIEGSTALLEEAIFGNDVEDPGETADAALELPFKKLAPQTDTASSNPYGIKEIVGIGESNFRGSPRNRRSNIAVGAKSLYGTIIAPDEEFSLLKALGTIDESAGYLRELVIKENKTVPEYGGGLCQIGTTTFRAALAVGLPVTERRNHSYRVPYYERDGAGKPIGPGKDATIYDPWPDLKFINDTGHALLLLTAISGDRLTFTFWGVKDGRVAEQTDSKVYNIVPPPEKKTIETTDLKPGETKCTESPHAGADAVFTYTVTYPDGEVKKKDFYSHYRPWGEVCLIGIDPDAQPAAGTPALPSADVIGASGD